MEPVSKPRNYFYFTINQIDNGFLIEWYDEKTDTQHRVYREEKHQILSVIT